MVSMENLSTAIQKFQFPQDIALEIQSRFEPFEKQAKEWEAKAKALVVTDISQTQQMAEAREARLALRRIRLDVSKQHELAKAEYLRKGQLLDLIKRTLTGYIEPLEAHLEAQEKFAEVSEAKRKKALYDERIAAIAPFRMPMDGLQNIPFGEMGDDTFNSLLFNLKAGQEARENQAKEAERKRQEDEQRIKDERERIRLEHEKLKKLQAMAQRLTALGFQWNDQHKGYLIELGGQTLKMDEIETVGDDEFNAGIKASETIIKTFREKQKRESDELAAKLKAETEARELAEKLLREQQAKEEKAKKDRLAAERKLKRGPDKEKLLNLADRIALIEPIQVKDDAAKAIYNNAVERLAQLVKDIKLQCEQL